MSYPVAFETWFKNFIDKDTEGGISNRLLSEDSGGLTNRGLTYKNFLLYSKDAGLQPTKENFYKLNDTQLKAIYYKRYWKAYRVDFVKPEYQIAVMDSVFNGGGIKSLAPVIGKNADGSNKRMFSTVEALNKSGLSVADLVKNREIYLKSLPNYSANKNGWSRRLKEILDVSADFIKKNGANPVIILLLFVLLISIYY